MILSKNRFALLGIMLWVTGKTAGHRDGGYLTTIDGAVQHKAGEKRPFIAGET